MKVITIFILKIAKIEVFPKHLNKILVLSVVIYSFSMFIWPLTQNCSWDYLLAVWHHWQGFNVGVLAFLTSLIAFKITKYREEEQRKRNFTAERAFLPHELDKLCEYLKACSKPLLLAHELAIKDNNSIELPSFPDKPESYKQVFADSIRYAEPEIAEHISYIIAELQVHNSRVTDLFKSLEEIKKVGKENIVSYIRCLAELYLMVTSLFPMARGESNYEKPIHDWKNYKSAYKFLEINYRQVDDLERHTKAIIKSRNN